MPFELEEEFIKESSEERRIGVIREASEMVKYKGILISAMIGKDVTLKDSRENTTFWDERQSGRGPFLFKKLVDLALGENVASNPIITAAHFEICLRRLAVSAFPTKFWNGSGFIY